VPIGDQPEAAGREKTSPPDQRDVALGPLKAAKGPVYIFRYVLDRSPLCGSLGVSPPFFFPPPPPPGLRPPFLVLLFFCFLFSFFFGFVFFFFFFIFVCGFGFFFGWVVGRLLVSRPRDCSAGVVHTLIFRHNGRTFLCLSSP